MHSKARDEYPAKRVIKSTEADSEAASVQSPGTGKVSLKQR
jgi:hypothetical protein